ncbi:MAG: hypothetical protein QG637_616, partial [Chloroflexota bacterium]|nr:hypothetical protein [Chloroflexota bacterium]
MRGADPEIGWTIVTNKICVLTCHNFAREVAACVVAQAAEEITVETFAGACLRPATDHAALTQAVQELTQAHVKVALFGGRCLAGLQGLPDGDQVAVCTADSCPELALNRPVIQAYTAAGAYVTTPGWLADWARLIERDGLDRAGLRELLGEATQRILLLDTGVYDDSADRLAAFAKFVGLPGEILPVGLDS